MKSYMKAFPKFFYYKLFCNFCFFGYGARQRNFYDSFAVVGLDNIKPR